MSDLLNTREQREYSMSRAIVALCDEVQGGKPQCFEFDVSQTMNRALAQEYRDRLFPLALGPQRAPGTLLVPLDHLERALLDSATSTKGAELKFVEPGPFLELLRAKAMTLRMGATVLSGLRGDVDLVRGTGTVTGSWVPESPTADVTASSLSLDRVALRAKELRFTTSASRKLVQQSTPQADLLVAADFIRAAAVELDRVAIRGTGTSNQPAGILNTAGIGSVAGGTNGAVPTYDHAVDLEFAVADASADDTEADGATDTLGYLTSPKVRQRLRKSPAIVGGNLPAWGRNELAGRRAEVSKNVPENLTKGTATTICHALIFGRWSDLIVGTWERVAEIVVDPLTQKKRADIELTFTIIADCALGHAPSFAAMQDALP